MTQTKDYSYDSISRRAELRDQEIKFEKMRIDEEKREAFQEQQLDYALDNLTGDQPERGEDEV